MTGKHWSSHLEMSLQIQRDDPVEFGVLGAMKSVMDLYVDFWLCYLYVITRLYIELMMYCDGWIMLIYKMRSFIFFTVHFYMLPYDVIVRVVLGQEGPYVHTRLRRHN